MALIKCTECGKEVSDSAQSCPACGHPIQNVQPAAPASVKKKKKGGFIAIAVAAVIIIGGFLATLGNSLPDNGPNTASTPDEGNTTSPQETEDNAAQYAVGDTISIGDWEITVDNFEVADQIPGSFNTYFTPDEGSKYVVAHLTLKNTATSARSFKGFSANEVECIIKYQDAYKYSSSTLLAHSDDLNLTTLNPLETVSGILAYSVPDEAALSDELVFEVSKGFTSYTVKIS